MPLRALFLVLEVPNTTMAEFTNTVDPDEIAYVCLLVFKFSKYRIRSIKCT